MTNSFAPWVDLAWFPIVMALVWTLGARRAAPIAILGAYLFLPPHAQLGFLQPLMVEKRTIAGPAFLLAVLIFDRRSLLQFRPSWLDLPIVAYVFCPLVGLAWHRFDQVGGSIDQAWLLLNEWAIPYLIARVYFGDADGPRRLAGAIVVGGLIYVPICWYESAVGPGLYISGLVYGTGYHEGMVFRMGGYRPEGFLSNGIELATWMALTTVMAAWLGLSFSGYRLFGLPGWCTWIVAAVLGATTLLCRGVYGYAELAIGLVATAFTLGLRTKALLVVLLLLPPAYLVTRTTHVWSGQEMREIARRADKEGTISIRLDSEDRVVSEVVGHDLAFGFGGRAPYWEVDSWWAVELRTGGVIGLVAWLLAFLFSVMLVIFRSRRRFPARSVEVGLALLVLIIMIHSLHNTSVFAALPLIGGALVSSILAGGPTVRVASKKPTSPSGGGPKVSIPLIVTVVVLALFEILGRLPRSPRIEAPESKVEVKP